MDINENNDKDMLLTKALNWLVNQSIPIVILIVMVIWQTRQNAALEAKIDQCNRDRIEMYKTQISIIIEALTQSKAATDNNSKVLENNSLMLQSILRKR